MRLVVILLILISPIVDGQMVNYYGFKDLSGTTLTDSKGTANGTLGGASLPTWSSNGYLSFVGGNNSTIGNYNRVTFATRTTFDYAYNSVFSMVVIFRSIKADASIHVLFSNSNLSIAYNKLYIYINSSEAVYFCVQDNASSPVKAASSAVGKCDGIWHIATMVYNNNVFTCYLDGQPLTTSTNNTATGNFYYSSSPANQMVFGNFYLSADATKKYAYDLTGDICNYINYSGALTGANVSDINNEFNLLQ